MGRISEINRLTWSDIDLRSGYVTLYTRKKSGGHLTPRRIWMTHKLHSILSERFASRKDDHPWVFPDLIDKENTITLRAYRTREDLTQRELAEKVGIPQRHISEMETGKSILLSTNYRKTSIPGFSTTTTKGRIREKCAVDELRWKLLWMERQYGRIKT